MKSILASVKCVSARRVRAGYPAPMNSSSSQPGRSGCAPPCGFCLVTAFDIHEPQLLVAPRQLDRHDAEVDLALRLPAVGVEDDVVFRGPARVPDEREVLHLGCVRLAHVRGIDDYQGVLVYEPLRVVHDCVLQALGESLRLEVPAEAVLHVAVSALRVDGARDVGEDRVASGLYPVHHVAYELVLRLRETVKHFHHKVVELGSRFPRNCAIIHGAVLSFVCFLAMGIIPELTGEKDGVFVFGFGIPAQAGSRLGDVMSDLGAACTATRLGECREYRAARARRAESTRSPGASCPVGAGLADGNRPRRVSAGRLEGARIAPQEGKSRASA